jgi:hypothetical protein
VTKAREVGGFSLDDVLDSADVGWKIVADEENPARRSGVTIGLVHRSWLSENVQQPIPLPVRTLSNR